MKFITKLVHRFVYSVRLDNLIAQFSIKVPYLFKLLPTNSEYKINSIKTVKRSGATFELLIGDYMQWHVYANLPEPLWSLAWKQLNENSIIFDIGANIGAFSLKSAAYLHQRKLQSSIYAIEPNPQIIIRLRKNVNLNPDLNKLIQIEEIALSDQKRIMHFTSGCANSGGGKLTNEKTGVEVKVNTLDSFVSEHDLQRVDLIKIDVEGFEPRVLKGANRTIETYKPILIIEITDEWFRVNGSSASEIINHLFGLGYTIYSDAFGSVKRVLHNGIADLPNQYNVLAIHG